MKSEIHDQGPVRIIALSGKITIGAGDIQLRQLVHQSVDEGRSKIVLDLGNVSTIDSSGIGEMVACYTTVTKRGGALKLLNLSPKINDILQVTQLITVFDVFDSKDEAISSF